MAALMRVGPGTGERMRRSTVPAPTMDPSNKKKVSGPAAWREARELIWTHRKRLTIGLALMLVGVFSRPLSTVGGLEWLTPVSRLAWPWYVPLGTALCVLSGLASARIRRSEGT